MDDPTLLHWRGVLVPLVGAKAVVVTPDRDIETTILEVGSIYQEILRYDGSRLPRGIRDKDTYLPRHSEKGRINPEEFRRLVVMGQRHHQGGEGRRRVSGKGRVVHAMPEIPEAHVDVPADFEDDKDFTYLAVYRSGPGGLGEEVIPPADAEKKVVDRKEFVLFSMGGEVMLVQKIPLRDLGGYQGALQAASPIVDPPERDVRIMPVMFDTANERWRTIHEASPDIEEVEYDDFPLQGPRTICHDIRQLRRLGMDFVQHHESWLRKSGVRNSDRSVYEHSSICRALNFMLCYDQLNVGALASSEALNRRRTLIEHAHQGRPDAPSYEGSEEFMGMRDSPDGSIIDPALTQHAARRQAARAEVLKQHRLAAEERKHLRGREEDPRPKKGDKPDKGAGRGAGGAAPSNP